MYIYVCVCVLSLAFFLGYVCVCIRDSIQMLVQEEGVEKPVSRREAILRDAPTSGGIQVVPSSIAERRRKGGNLRNFWYPVEFSPSLTSDKLIPFELFEDPWVLFRGPDGTPG